MWSIVDTPLGDLNYFEQETATSCNIACGLMMLRAIKWIKASPNIMKAAIKNSQSKHKLINPIQVGFTTEEVAKALRETWKITGVCHVNQTISNIRRLKK